MNETTRKWTDLMALLVFALFALCVLLVLLTGAKIYRNLVDRSRESYEARTAAQYITSEPIREIAILMTPLILINVGGS